MQLQPMFKNSDGSTEQQPVPPGGPERRLCLKHQLGEPRLFKKNKKQPRPQQNLL